MYFQLAPAQMREVIHNNNILSVGDERSFCYQLKITTANSLSKRFSCHRNNGEASVIF